MKISLITGGAGFIGSHLAEYLLAQGDQVVVLDNMSTGSRENLVACARHPNLRVVEDSVLNEPVLDDLLRQSDRVFHLAAHVGVKLVVNDPAGVMENNVFGVHNILRLSRKHQRPVFLASTSEVFGKSRQVPFREDADLVIGPPNRSRWSYACSKAAGEFMAHAYVKQYGLSLVIGRFFNTTGPRQTGRYGMVLPRFVEQALSGMPLTVYGDGSQSRCFSHVWDIVRAMVKLIETPKAYGESINLGGQELITIQALAERVIAMTGSRSSIRYLSFEEAYEPGFEDLPVRQPDLGKARALIGFSASKTLNDIISDVMAEKRVKPGTTGGP